MPKSNIINPSVVRNFFNIWDENPKETNVKKFTVFLGRPEMTFVLLFSDKEIVLTDLSGSAVDYRINHIENLVPVLWKSSIIRH